MSKLLAGFLIGVFCGGVGVSAIVLAAGDPYDYAVLRPYACERITKNPAELWAGESVPGQPNPCFIRYPRWPIP